MFDRFGVGSPPPFGVRGGILAIGVHAVILAYGFRAVHGASDSSKPQVAPPMIFVPDPHPRGSTVAPLVIGDPGPIELLIRDVPSTIPDIPGQAIPTEPMPNPEDLIGSPRVGDSNGIYDTNVVEQAPELLSSPPPRYPELLRLAHVEGTVIVEGVVDTLGRMEPKTLRVLASPHPALSASALECLAGAVFRPGRAEGRAVRVLVQVPVRFNIATRRSAF